MTPRLPGHFSIFDLDCLLLKSLLGIATQRSREKIYNFALKASVGVNLEFQYIEHDGS